ncbi:MAG: hypothetical protein P1U56_24615 [Saprospiraceae bacterium]|nr:hypothetical protein [Saprospiraceae bacterium]
MKITILFLITLCSCSEQQLQNGTYRAQNDENFYYYTLFSVTENELIAKEISEFGIRTPLFHLNRRSKYEFSNDSLSAEFNPTSNTITFLEHDSIIAISQVTKINEQMVNISIEEVLKILTNKHIQLLVDNENYFESNLFSNGLSFSIKDTVDLYPHNNYEVFQLDNQLFITLDLSYPRPIQIKNVSQSKIEGSILFHDTTEVKDCVILINEIGKRKDKIYGEWIEENKNTSIIINPKSLIFKFEDKIDTVKSNPLNDNLHIAVIPSKSYKTKISKFRLNKDGDLEITDYRGRHENRIYIYKRAKNNR